MTLRRLILTKTGQDVQKCRGCQLCYSDDSREMDIPMDSLIQLVIMNDEEVLTSRTLWSDEVLHSAHDACARELDLEKIIVVLREEAIRRGLVKPEIIT